MDRNLEEKLCCKSKVVGIDEVGRGCLAGPVVCAAIYIPPDAPRPQAVRDSKRIGRETEREDIYTQLTHIPGVEWYASVIPPDRIDEINILNATMLGMEQCALSLEGSLSLEGDTRSYWFLVDGNRVPHTIKDRATAVVKGDDTEYIIAAASIIAKVTRDRLMKSYDEIYPEYGFAQHKGYGTKKHISAIEEHGVTPIHRMSFAPCKNFKKKYNQI